MMPHTYKAVDVSGEVGLRAIRQRLAVDLDVDRYHGRFARYGIRYPDGAGVSTARQTPDCRLWRSANGGRDERKREKDMAAGHFLFFHGILPLFTEVQTDHRIMKHVPLYATPDAPALLTRFRSSSFGLSKAILTGIASARSDPSHFQSNDVSPYAETHDSIPVASSNTDSLM
jgi:hypothetical protein